MHRRFQSFRFIAVLGLLLFLIGTGDSVFAQFDGFSGFGSRGFVDQGFSDKNPPLPPSRQSVQSLIVSLDWALLWRGPPGEKREEIVDSIAETLAELETLGLDAAPALPLLLQCLDREQAEIRGGALRVLTQLGPDAEPALPQLLRLIERASRENAPSHIRAIRDELIVLLRAMGPEAAPLIPDILSRFDRASRESSLPGVGGRDPFNCNAFSIKLFDSISFMGPDSANAIPLLVELIEEGSELDIGSSNRNGYHRMQWAFDRLGMIGPPALPTLIELLSHPDYNVRMGACDSLQQMGNEAADAIPALEDFLRENVDVFPRDYAAWTLVAISDGGFVSDEAYDLITAQYQEDPNYRFRHGPRLISSLRPVKASTVKMLLSQAENNDSYESFGAIGQLGELGAEAAAVYPECVPRLIAILEDGMPRRGPLPILWSNDNWNVIDTLGAIGPAAEPALPCLLRIIQKRQSLNREDDLMFVLDDNSSRSHSAMSQCISAIQAIYEIDPDNPGFIETLLDILEEGDVKIFDEAVQSLTKIALSGIAFDTQRAVRSVQLRFDDRDSTDKGGGPYYYSTRQKRFERSLASLCFNPEDQEMFEHVLNFISEEDISDDYAVRLLRGNEFSAIRAIRQADAWGSSDARQETLKNIQTLVSVKKYTWFSIGGIFSSDAPKSYAAVDMMTMLDPEGQESGPLLIDLFTSPYHNDVELCDKIAESIAILPNGRELLHEQACDSSEPVPCRTPAIRALGEWPEEHPILVAFLSQESARIRLAALQGLQRLGPDAEFVVEDIERLLNDDLITIRRAAQTALSDIDSSN
jgi:HEAT repeat protein